MSEWHGGCVQKPPRPLQPPSAGRTGRRPSKVTLGEVLEPRILATKGETDYARRTVTLLANDNLSDTLGITILVVELITIDQGHNVCILFNGAGFPQIRQLGTWRFALLHRPAQLGEGHNWYLQLFGQGFQGTGNF